MDVVGNNIANVNTTGFKQSRVTFQDVLSQTVRSASGPQGGRAGVNPEQVGLGVLLSGVETIQTQGTLQSTGKLTDMAIQGDGYFVVNDGKQNFFTRDGAFDLGIDGTFLNPASGLKVMGWQANNGAVDPTQPPTAITIPLGAGMTGHASTELTIGGNLDANAGAPSTVTGSLGGQMTISGTYTPTVAHTYTVTFTAPNTWSAVDETGNSAPSGLTFAAGTPAPTSGETFKFSASPPSITFPSTVYDSLGSPHQLSLTLTKSGTSWTVAGTLDGTALAPAATPLTFGPNGQISSTATWAATVPAFPSGATMGTGGTLNIDFSDLTQLAGVSDLTNGTDGASAGSLTDWTVGPDGTITGTYSNGSKETLGQIALASFANPAGLTKSGSNLLQASPNSGNANVGVAGTGGRGAVSSGFLEMSNVDLAQQFTNMIMAERGFQANSKVITTSDAILQDLINLKQGG
jgi:flagellar hook protein FlgE